jgi:hypothetical protein
MKVNRWTAEWAKPDEVGSCVPINGGQCIIVQIVDKEIALSTIIHESVHVWQLMCSYMQETDPGIEAEAYTIENVSMLLLRHYQRLTGEKIAIHEERKARLQKGSRQVHIEAGSNQEANGTECSPQGNGESGESPQG